MAGDSEILRNLKSLRDEIFLVLSTQAKERENQRRERESAKLLNEKSKIGFQNQRNLRISPTPEISPTRNRKVSIYSIINSGTSNNHILNLIQLENELDNLSRKPESGTERSSRLLMKDLSDPDSGFMDRLLA